MKKIIICLICILWGPINLLAQDEVEETSPIRNAELIRKVWEMDIEGCIYQDVVVNIKSNSPDGIFVDKYRCKVQVTDKGGELIWKKTFKNAYLYIFSSGQIQIGRPNFNQLIIYSSKFSGESDVLSGKYKRGIIREKEGVY